MTSPVSDHDRHRAWLAMRRRAETGAPFSWRSAEVDDAILARASDRRFDALLVEVAAAEWNAAASALGDAVNADLTAAWPGHADTVTTYVGLQLYDWLMLPSRAGMARENLLVPTALLIDLEKLCRGWGALLAEYRSTSYQAEMNIGHNGIAPFPSHR